jgi:hypothetical protein
MMLAEATSQPTVSQWVTDLAAVWNLIGGAAGIIAIIIALRHAGILGRVQEKATEAKKVADANRVALVETREKVNEVARENPAEVTPLPPMPKCPDESTP